MNITPKEIEAYCVERSTVPSALCNELEAHTHAHVPMARMLIGRLEASLLGFLLKTVAAKRVLEIGTFTGYSALAMAEQLPADGEVITLDINPETVQLAKTFWARSAHGKKIRSVIGPAVETIKDLSGPFDLVFIDADKGNYLRYLELALPKLSPQGMVVLDNCLWSGKVLSPEKSDQDTVAIDHINRWIEKHSGLYGTLLPVRDGMFLVRKLI